MPSGDLPASGPVAGRGSSRDSGPSPARSAAAISLAYLVVGALWILFSDRFADRVFGADPQRLSFVQTIKGWAFVLASGILLHVLVYRALVRSARARLALHGSELRFRELMERASDGILLATADGRVLDVNDRGCSLFGRDREELLARSLTFLFPDEGRTRDVANRLRLVAERPAGSGLLDLELPRRDAPPLPIEISASHVGDGLVLALLRDVSARRRVEELLAVSEARFRDLCEAMSEAVLELDETGRIQAGNPAAEALLQRSRRELAGCMFEQLVAPEQRREARELFERARDLQRFEAGRVTWAHGLVTELSACPIRRDGRPAGVLLLAGGPGASTSAGAPPQRSATV